MEISKWMWIPADEEVDIMWCMPPEEGTGEKLVWMQGKVGGYIERLPPHITASEPLWLSCGFDIPTIANFNEIENVWCNEEGLIQGFSTSHTSSPLCITSLKSLIICLNEYTPTVKCLLVGNA